MTQALKDSDMILAGIKDNLELYLMVMMFLKAATIMPPPRETSEMSVFPVSTRRGQF